jgi:hypothetical protein
MTAELGRESSTGEEVLALKKHISKCNVKNEQLKEVIISCKARDAFLYSYR